MKLKDLETHLLITAAAMRSLFGVQPRRVIRAQYRKKRDKKNAMAKQSRKRNRND